MQTFSSQKQTTVSHPLFRVRRGQTSFWHTEYENAGGSVNLISLCEAESQQTCRWGWYGLALLVSVAQLRKKPNPRLTKLVTVTNTGGQWQHTSSDFLTLRSKRTSYWGWGRSQTLSFAKNKSEGVVTVSNVLANVPGVYRGQAFFFCRSGFSPLSKGKAASAVKFIELK